MSEKEKSIIEKFEIDEDTSELKIIEVPASELAKEDNKKAEISTKDNPKPLPSVGKQLIMKQILGFDPTKEINKKQKLLKYCFSFAFIILVVGVLAWTAFNDFAGGELPPWQTIVNTFGDNWYHLLFALGCVATWYLTKALRLSVMCKSLVGHWYFKTCLQTGIVGIYYNNVTPLAVGGQPFEIHYLSKHGIHGGVASSMPIATFFLNQFAFVSLGIISLALFAGNTLGVPTEMIGVIPKITSILAIVGLTLCIAVPILVITFCFMPRVGATLVKFVAFIGTKLKIIKNPQLFKYKTLKTVVHNARCLKRIAKRPIPFICMMLLSFCEQLAICSIAFFTLKFFGFDWSVSGATPVGEWAQVVQLCFILYAAISFIPTPGNSGAADLSFYLLFKTGLGLSNSAQYSGFAFPAMITWRLLSFYSTIIIGFIFTSIKKRQDKRLIKKQKLE